MSKGSGKTSKDCAVDAFRDGLALDLALSYTDWADECFYLPRESSSEYGRYRSARTPFVREILDDLSPMSPAETVVLIKPTQTAGTTIGLIFLCGMIDMYPGPALMIMPTDSMARSFSKKKLAPTIKAVPRLRSKVKEQKSRAGGNTILQKDFPGGSLALTGSNSGASYRSESIKYLVLDDFDGFELDIDGEGSPEELADRRTGTFPGRKIYINSTTTTKDASNIERAFDHSSQGYFHVPCPHCGGLQYLTWGGKDTDFGIKFERNEAGEVVDCWYQCEHCHQRIDEHHKTAMCAAGVYVHRYPERVKTRGFRYNALVSPAGWVNSWAYIAKKFLEAAAELKKGNPQKYQVWMNSFMSEPFEQVGDRPEWATIKARAEPYQALTVPAGAMILAAGVDVQHNRLAVSVWAYGRKEESWLIYHIEIHGDPMHDDVWQQLDLLISGTFPGGGVQHHISSVGVDAGDGATTQAVRNYCRTRAPKVFALKGSSTPGRPVVGAPTKQDLTWNGEKIEDGVEMWPIGTDTAKVTIYTRMKINDPGPGRIHTYVGLDDEYYKQLTAEKLVTRFVKGYPVREWHNVRGSKRNEALDCAVYAYAAAIRAGLPYLDLKSELKPPPVVRRPAKNHAPARRKRW